MFCFTVSCTSDNYNSRIETSKTYENNNRYGKNHDAFRRDSMNSTKQDKVVTNENNEYENNDDNTTIRQAQGRITFVRFICNF